MINDPIISWCTNADVDSTRYYSAHCDDIPTLELALETELKHKKRKGAIRILEMRIKRLKKEAEMT